MDDSVLTTVKRLPGVRSAYMLSSISLPPSGAEPEATQRRLLSALIGALGRSTDAMAIGAIGEAMIEGAAGSIVVRSLGENVGAVVVTEAKANVGLVRLELRKLPRA